MNIDEPITVTPYNPAWVAQFAAERAVLCRALAIEPSRVEHIGSTAVMGLHAKPIVDIMLGLDSFPAPPALSDRLGSLGYEALGEAGVPGRLYFRKRAPTAFNAQAVVFRGPLWRDNLLLRDFLIAHPAEAQRYSDEKLRAFHAGHRTLLSYSAAKASAIAGLLAAAHRCNQAWSDRFRYSKMSRSSDYWDALAPHHSSIENNYLDLPSLGRIIHDIRQPVLVVGAGQGLIVEGLLKKGFQTDGVDLSSEMIRYAKRRRRLTIIEADAKALPFGAGAYETIIYATGVVDFMGDEEQIAVILNEARRVINQSGKIFVAFYKLSAASEEFLAKLGLLRNSVLSLRETLEIYRMTPVQTIAWVAKKAEVGFFAAGILSLRAWALSTLPEKKAAFNMQRIFRNMDHASSLINSAPERQPYRNESEIRNLFKRLAIPMKKVEATSSCVIVQI